MNHLSWKTAAALMLFSIATGTHAESPAEARQRCERLAYNLPGGMVPESYSDIPRVCANGWPAGSADHRLCVSRLQQCWGILSGEAPPQEPPKTITPDNLKGFENIQSF